jgi:hypothetical protein
MNKARLGEGVGGEKLQVRVKVVGADADGVKIGLAGDICYYKAVVKAPPLVAKLHHVSRHGEPYGNDASERAFAFVRCDEVIKILDPAPGRRPVVGGIVVPAVYRGTVHDPAPGIYALRHEIRAVAAQ